MTKDFSRLQEFCDQLSILFGESTIILVPSITLKWEIGLANKLFMPTSLIRRIGIRAPAETIYRALTTPDGIRTCCW